MKSKKRGYLAMVLLPLCMSIPVSHIFSLCLEEKLTSFQTASNHHTSLAPLCTFIINNIKVLDTAYQTIKEAPLAPHQEIFNNSLKKFYKKLCKMDIHLELATNALLFNENILSHLNKLLFSIKESHNHLKHSGLLTVFLPPALKNTNRFVPIPISLPSSKELGSGILAGGIAALLYVSYQAFKNVFAADEKAAIQQLENDSKKINTRISSLKGRANDFTSKFSPHQRQVEKLLASARSAQKTLQENITATSAFINQRLQSDKMLKKIAALNASLNDLSSIQEKVRQTENSLQEKIVAKINVCLKSAIALKGFLEETKTLLSRKESLTLTAPPSTVAQAVNEILSDMNKTEEELEGIIKEITDLLSQVALPQGASTFKAVPRLLSQKDSK